MSIPEPKAARLENHNSGHGEKSSTQLPTRDSKRGHDESAISIAPKSKAAKFNAHTLRKLQTAFDKNPEIDLTTQMPTEYSVRLVEFQGEFWKNVTGSCTQEMMVSRGSMTSTQLMAERLLSAQKRRE
ncbi:hypothetical protein NUU61_003015 [Penicillium alfredii]|uniref:Uncharacterized protein n=1 Tax=Penicillium alfredii TaxID=1506179 RepID=A0A9W9FSQ0_9EURO|nr:uncharacterized protein NUU61_003015 [Penicillium alfredii]KAJ5105668.1 hypothetical protein NUU61_003015 [Penicillium alfredii]